MIIAAGTTKGPKLIILTAITFAVIKQETKIAATVTKRKEYFMIKILTQYLDIYHIRTVILKYGNTKQKLMIIPLLSSLIRFECIREKSYNKF